MSKKYIECTVLYADIWGSFLRPEDIKVARVKFAKGDITSEELKLAEDKCIAELIEKQKKAGLQVITGDGTLVVVIGILTSCGA